MHQAKPRFTTFADYLSYSETLEGRFQLIHGELCELLPESRFNSTIAVRILVALFQAGVAIELIHPGKCEIQVPVLALDDAANRYPDLVVLREEHLELTKRRLTITLDMPPPQLVVEVVSPGKNNRERDDQRKRAQYAAIGVAEDWLVDPSHDRVIVLDLRGDDYVETGTFQNEAAIASSRFPKLFLNVAQIMADLD
jgi:Uma2 family endonuclease